MGSSTAYDASTSELGANFPKAFAQVVYERLFQRRAKLNAGQVLAYRLAIFS